MFGLPKATEYGRRAPKERFYKHLALTPKIKDAFVDQIKNIIWANKLAPATINIPKGPKVEEIQVFVINLKMQAFNEGILKVLDSQIPYFIVYALCLDNKCKLYVGYKEGLKSDHFSVKEYFSSAWLNMEDITLEIKGLNLDEVYENFIKQIGKEKLIIHTDNEDIGSAVERTKQIEKLETEVARLEKKQYTEVQPKRKYEIHERVLKIKEQLEELRDGKAEDAHK